MDTTQIYTPAGCSTLDVLEDGQVRCGIQGPGFSGKTTAALTFPNPIVASFDRKVTAHTYRTDVINVPFYDGEFCDKIVRRNGLQTPPNRRDALLKWLSTEGLKLTPSQTLLMDNSTGIEEAFHTQYWLSPVISKSGEVDSFAEWRQKVDFFGDLHSAFKALRCNVVYLTHEAPDRDKKGEINGKVRPLLTGQAGDKLIANFTDWFASITINKPITSDQGDKIMKWAGIDKSTLEEWIASTPATHQTIYLWQTTSDDLRSCGTTTLHNVPKYVLANYSSFAKYRRQPKQNTK